MTMAVAFFLGSVAGTIVLALLIGMKIEKQRRRPSRYLNLYGKQPREHQRFYGYKGRYPTD